MNEVIHKINAENLVMTSREITDLVESRHDKVKQSIKRLAERGAIQHPPMGDVKNDRGQRVSVYWVGKRDSFVVVAQLSPEFTARLVDRWQQLEKRHIQQVPQSLPEALRLAAAMAEKNAALTQETNRLQGVCHDLARNLRDGMTPVAFCRMLNGVNTQKVQPMLLQGGYLLKAKYGYRAASRWRDKLFTERKVNNQDDQLCESVVLTKRGAKWLYSLYEKRQLAMKSDWDGKYSHVLFDEQETAA